METGLRDIAPGAVADLWVQPDLAAWERAEGPRSAAAVAAVARRDVERWIPGLPARRTYKVLGWVVVAAILADAALAWLPATPAVDALEATLRYGTAGIGVAVALWSLLSEVRGWEGSDAATWFHKARVDRHERALAARRRVLAGTRIAIGPDGLVVWREAGGQPAAEAVAPAAILGLVPQGERHMVLELATSAGPCSIGWLPRDPAFEAGVARIRAARS